MEAAKQPGPVLCDLLLTGGTVVTVDQRNRIIDRGFVAIRGDRILAVGGPDDVGSMTAARQISCAGRIVMPGLIDCHNHLFQSLGRTLGEGLNGWEWLSRFMWPYAAQISPEETIAAVYLGAVEAVLAGTTSVLDHHYGRTDPATTLAVASALEEVGLRGKVARGMAGPYTEPAERQGLPAWAFSTSLREELAITEECMKSRPKGSKVEIWPGPINAVYTDQTLVAAAVELARSHGVGWHTHCSAPAGDPEVYLQTYGLRPATWLHTRGLLGPDAVLAHATWVDDEEIDAIGSTKTAIAHCPLSNLYVPYGVMPLQKLLDAGATVGLGSDGSACGHRQDLFENMKLMVLMHRLNALDPRAASASQALDLATQGGAQVHGIEAGTLAPGALADVIVLDASRSHTTPMPDPISAVVYSAGSRDVVMNIIGGEIVVDGGRCTRIDEDTVIAEAAARAGELRDRIGFRRPASR